MISNYLSLLYANCKVFAKTSAFTKIELLSFFKTEIHNSLVNYKLNSEEELVDFLVSSPYKQLQDIFDKSKFLHVFYLINSLNEYSVPNELYDDLGRFKLECSVLKTHGIEHNFVLVLMKKSVEEHPLLQAFFKITNHNSYFYLSHDIDSVFGSLKQDGLWAIKNGKINVLMSLFFNLIALKPDWLNMDLIMKTESEYDFKSTFYWLVNKGKVDARQTNSDYSIFSSRIVKEIEKVKRLGFENGLHKSISRESFSSEIEKMPVNVIGNRYHYLKFNLPNGYDMIEKSGLKLDASLGFAEQYGFRNGYGYPFHPFNVSQKECYSFIEVPLNVMDGTFQRYMKIPVEKTADTIINFLEQNKQNALLSILWHNTFFSNYKHKGYLNEYKKILAYLYENKFQNINQSEIIKEFSWQNK